MSSEKRTAVPNSLNEHWMPFTSNKDFKENPRLIVEAKGVYLKNHQGQTQIDASSGLFCNPLGHGRQEIIDAISNQLKAFNANRFVGSNPRNCMRIKWLNHMFPNAYYIVITRDTKSVINSMYQVITKKRKKWGKKFLEPPSTLRGYGHIKKILGENDSDFQTCLDWYKLYKNTLNNDLQLVNERTIHVKYEDFVKDSQNTIKTLYDFTELKWYDELNSQIPEQVDLTRNERWKLLPDKEKEIFAHQAKESGKPENIIEKIVSGKMEKFYEENCVLEQPFIKDTNITVQELIKQKIALLGENINIGRFARFEV